MEKYNKKLCFCKKYESELGNLLSPNRRRSIAALLSTTALIGVLTVTDSVAQVTIDGPPGTQETVIGAGGGSQASPWTIPGTGALNVGSSQNGRLEIGAGGRVESNSASIGVDATGDGEVLVTGAGATWDNQSSLRLGVDGTGRLRVEDGGTVIMGGTSFIGVFSGSSGTLTVTGAGSGVQAQNNLEIGDGGTGIVQVQNGGAVTVSGASLIGSAAGAQATVTVSGAGSSWTTQRLSAGFSGEGTLTVSDGATLQSADALIADQTGSTGETLITGAGSRWTNSGPIRIGSRGEGLLRIEDGAEMTTSSFAILGAAVGAEGTVTITGEDSAWSPNSLFIGQLGTGSLTLSDGGRLAVGGGSGAASLGFSAGSTGVLNIGAPAGQAAAGAGTLEASAVSFGAGDGRLVFNHTGDNYRFAADVTGGGVIEHHAGSTVFTGTLQHSGGTRLIGGTMLVNGQIAGNVELSGGVLGGTGRLAAVTVMNGATLAPGGSIGTTQAVDVTFEAGSTFAVEVNAAGQSDLLDASGTVTIDPGAEISILPETPGDDGTGFAADTQYTVLTAAGGLTGQFDTVTDAFAFLDADLTYGATELVLTLSRNDTAFASLAVTPNQREAAGAVQALGAGNPLFDAVLSLSPAEARASYDRLSGEIQPSFDGLLVEQSGALRRATQARLDAVFRGGGEGLGVWSEAYGWTGERDESEQLDFDYYGGGLIVGADAAVAPDWRVGLMGAFGRSWAELDAVDSESDADSYALGVYSGYRLGSLGLRLGGSYSYHSVDGTREVRAGTLDETLRSDYDAQTFQVYGEVGNRFAMPVVAVEPFAGLAYVFHDTDNFIETGGVSALSVSPELLETSYATLGLRADSDFTLAGMPVTAFGSVAWQRAFGDTEPESRVAFAGGGGFDIAGMPIAEDSAVVTLGARQALSERMHMSFAYSGAFADGLANHNATLRVGLQL